jgi:hypothetical protein
MTAAADEMDWCFTVGMGIIYGAMWTPRAVTLFAPAGSTPHSETRATVRAPRPAATGASRPVQVKASVSSFVNNENLPETHAIIKKIRATQ